MSKYLGNTPFQELLTHSIAEDPTIEKVAKTLDLVFDKSVLAIPDVLLFARLAKDSGFVNPVPMLSTMERVTELAGGLKQLPSDILDLLAWQLHVDAYDTLGTLDSKRKMIQQSLMLHRRKGTKWSVLNALLTRRSELPTDITEWFQYGGLPYFFRVHFDVSEHEWVLQDFLDVLLLVFEYKNVRSWLEYIETKVKRTVYKYCGVGLYSKTKARDNLWFDPPPPMPVDIYRGVYVRSKTDMQSNLYFAPPDPMPVNKYLGIDICGYTKSKFIYWFFEPKPVEVKVNVPMTPLGYTKSRISAFKKRTRS